MKKIFDYLFTLPGILVILPINLVTMVLVRLKIGSPVLFAQDCPGLNGKPFRIYKFRTMTDERDLERKLFPAISSRCENNG